jgi:hypothetical protein
MRGLAIFADSCGIDRCYAVSSIVLLLGAQIGLRLSVYEALLYTIGFRGSPSSNVV